MRQLTIKIDDKVHAHLVRLLETGLFGESLNDVIDRLVCEGIIRSAISAKAPPR